jgi:hypothetical protein
VIDIPLKIFLALLEEVRWREAQPLCCLYTKVDFVGVTAMGIFE